MDAEQVIPRQLLTTVEHTMANRDVELRPRRGLRRVLDQAELENAHEFAADLNGRCQRRRGEQQHAILADEASAPNEREAPGPICFLVAQSDNLDVRGGGIHDEIDEPDVVFHEGQVACVASELYA